MGTLFRKVKADDRAIAAIDWDMTPDISFGTFESWGGRERVRNNDELIYYFYVSNWGHEPVVCLMERGVKHAKILAKVHAPRKMVSDCVRDQGSSSIFEKSYAIDGKLKKWLLDHVVDHFDESVVEAVVEEVEVEDMGSGLPPVAEVQFGGEQVVLPSAPAVFVEQDLPERILKWNLYDSKLNPQGDFANALGDNGDGLTVTDCRTGLMWQRAGLDISSHRVMRKKIAELNEQGFAGFDDWRLPTLEEALSLMEPALNDKGVHLDPCFSAKQPFIFIAAQRTPGGYWFVDYKQGRPFWSSGTIPGGFGRLCRKA